MCGVRRAVGRWPGGPGSGHRTARKVATSLIARRGGSSTIVSGTQTASGTALWCRLLRVLVRHVNSVPARRFVKRELISGSPSNTTWAQALPHRANEAAVVRRPGSPVVKGQQQRFVPVEVQGVVAHPPYPLGRNNGSTSASGFVGDCVAVKPRRDVAPGQPLEIADVDQFVQAIRCGEPHGRYGAGLVGCVQAEFRSE